MLATLGLVIEYWRAWRGHYVRSRQSVSTVFPLLPNQRG